MSWQQGRPTIDALLAGRQASLQRVAPSREQADYLLGEADAHVTSAMHVMRADPSGAYALAYDAARKALVAILENQGLRPTSFGGHIVVYEAVRAQLDPPLGNVIRPFNRMRRRRNDSEYPPVGVIPVTTSEVNESLVRVKAIIEVSKRVLDEMGPY